MENFILNKKLKQLIDEHDLSIPKLSKLTGISRKTLDNWSLGQKPRNISQVKKVASFFNITVDELCFDGSDVERSTVIDQYKDEINAGVYEVILKPITNRR